MDDTIRTLDPAGKQGIDISRARYEAVRAAIVATLHEQGGMTFGDLTQAVSQRLAGSFDGSINWYVTTVKLDLEAHGVLARVPHARPQHLALTGAV